MKRIIIAILLSAFCATMWGQNKKDIKTYETAVILMNEGKYKEALPLLKRSRLLQQGVRGRLVDIGGTLCEDVRQREADSHIGERGQT